MFVLHRLVENNGMRRGFHKVAKADKPLGFNFRPKIRPTSSGFGIILTDLNNAPNPSKVRTRTRPCAAHEVSLLTSTTNCVIEIEDTVVASGSSGTPAAIEKSPLDFSDENPPLVITESGDIAIVKVIYEASLEKKVTAMGPVVNKRRHKRGNKGTQANAPPKVSRKDHVASHPLHSTLEGKSLAAIKIEAGSAITAPATQETPVSDPEPLSYAEPRPTPEQDIA
ncbi:hypothetical protein Tco_0349159 [Tanacetum coccineum]